VSVCYPENLKNEEAMVCLILNEEAMVCLILNEEVMVCLILNEEAMVCVVLNQSRQDGNFKSQYLIHVVPSFSNLKYFTLHKIRIYEYPIFVRITSNYFPEKLLNIGSFKGDAV
jgi:hypothetical protein